MNRNLGMAYCGLACCACSENDACVGCKSEGCTNKEGCKHLHCCTEKGLNGCWECALFPCADDGGSLHNLFSNPRIRVFAQYIRDNGEQKMFDCLEQNEKNGVVYHDKGQLVGDYDRCKTAQHIIDLLESNL